MLLVGGFTGTAAAASAMEEESDVSESKGDLCFSEIGSGGHGPWLDFTWR